MKSTARRALAVASAAVFAGASLAVAAPAASAIQIKSVGQAHYVSVDDLAPHEFDAIDNAADQINDLLPGEEEIVFVVNKRGPKSAIGIWNPNRITLAVECDPETDTWESMLRGMCSGNEEALLPR